ncbi:MAG: hypothetical protein O7A63_00470 [Acidobacteria bacterium]|nr:hypothetical protein [Acidobacteriota bacterium]
MIGSRRLLMAVAVLALLPLAACSKTDDQPIVREIFGTPPVITSATIAAFDKREVRCDMTDPYRFIAQRDFPFLDQNQVAIDLDDLEVGMDYTEITFSVAVIDDDDDPDIAGQDNILAVTATFVPPGQPDDGSTKEEQSLVLFDDGSLNEFSFTQIGTVDLVCDESTGTLTCSRLGGFLLTSNDVNENDGSYERKIATFDLDLGVVDSVLLVQDCLAKVKNQVILDVDSGESFDFRLDVIDRQGNITTWPDPFPITAQKTTFYCAGDDCLCCLLEDPIFTNCSGQNGFGGFCGSF